MPCPLFPNQACSCLAELELAWPGLLHDRLALLHALAADETTHVAQAYARLLAVALAHHVRLVAAGVLPPAPFPAAAAAAAAGGLTSSTTFSAPEHLRRPASSSSSSAAASAPALDPASPWFAVRCTAQGGLRGLGQGAGQGAWFRTWFRAQTVGQGGRARGLGQGAWFRARCRVQGAAQGRVQGRAHGAAVNEGHE